MFHITELTVYLLCQYTRPNRNQTLVSIALQAKMLT